MTLHVLAFTKTSSIGPSSRYRYLQYQERLRSHGVELECRPLFGPTWFRLLTIRPRWLAAPLKCLYAWLRFTVRLGQLFRLGSFDLIVIEHQLFPYLPPWGERWLSARQIPWTLEFDDAIYLTRFHPTKMRTLSKLATHVVVGNETLARFARPLQDRVSIVPTTIPMERYPDRLERPGRSEPSGPGEFPAIVIGWIGLPYNYRALKQLEGPLRRLSAEHSISLRVVSSGSPPLSGFPMAGVAWSYESEVDALSEFDIGVMPLLDDEWSRGKCGLKILQYFAARIPVVASPVGVNEEIIDDGENGLLAATEEDWYQALRRLIESPSLRQKLADAGRRTVEERYSADVWGGEIATLWRGIAESARVDSRSRSEA